MALTGSVRNCSRQCKCKVSVIVDCITWISSAISQYGSNVPEASHEASRKQIDRVDRYTCHSRPLRRTTSSWHRVSDWWSTPTRSQSFRQRGQCDFRRCCPLSYPANNNQCYNNFAYHIMPMVHCVKCGLRTMLRRDCDRYTHEMRWLRPEACDLIGLKGAASGSCV